MDTVGHSNFITQALKRKKERDIERRVTCKGACLNPVTVSTVQDADLRLKSESFRRAVRLVFSYLGIENTVRNFQKWDNQIAWEEFAHNIQNPTKTARVNVLWHGEKSGTTITIKLPGRTRTEAIKKIDTKRYKFVEWAW